MKDKWYDKYGLIKAEIDFDFHLCEDDVTTGTQIVDGVRIIEIKNADVEFGFEDLKKKGKRFITIPFGFGGVTVSKEDFEKALMHYRIRQLGIDEIGKKMREDKKKEREKKAEEILKRGALNDTKTGKF
jgi:hypothetical protein